MLPRRRRITWSRPAAQLPSSADGHRSPARTISRSPGASATINVHFNDGIGPDPLPSPVRDVPLRTRPTPSTPSMPRPASRLLTVTLTDDDGGSDSDGGNVIVTGTATTHRGSRAGGSIRYSGNGAPHIDAADRRRLSRNRQRSLQRVLRDTWLRRRRRMFTRFSRRMAATVARMRSGRADGRLAAVRQRRGAWDATRCPSAAATRYSSST